jgi:hypothetical protein
LSSWTRYPRSSPTKRASSTPSSTPRKARTRASAPTATQSRPLIFGVLASIPLGLIFGIVGLVKSKTYRSGKVMSWIGIVLSIVWIIPVVAVLVTVAPRIAKANDEAKDPGCVAVESSIRPYGHDALARFDSDANCSRQGLRPPLAAKASVGRADCGDEGT